MKPITEEHIKRLIEIESQVHYSTPPDLSIQPFVTIIKQSPVLLSAPHGAMTLRNNHQELWHEEDESNTGSRS